MLYPPFDYESFSEADISYVGSAAYAQHPSTEILSNAYDLGTGPRIWFWGLANPKDLIAHVNSGGIISAWNAGFELEMWNEVATRQLGWPKIKVRQVYDDAWAARAWGLPGKLEKAAEVLGTEVQKQKYNKRLWRPRKQTKYDKRTRITPLEDPENYMGMLGYNQDDIRAERCIAERCPPLTGEELEFAWLTAEMNHRGMQVDMESIHACIRTIEREYSKANTKLYLLTDGLVESATQTQRMKEWLVTQGLVTNSLDQEHREELLIRPWHPDSKVGQALKLWDLVTGAGVRKLYRMRDMATEDGRLKYLYIFHGARTGRDAGQDVQPQNLVKAGHTWFDGSPWSWEYAEECLDIIRNDQAHLKFENPVLAVSGCIRSLFIAAPDKELICSDYSSIEAVVTACLAGEQWRIDAFKRGERIYLHGAATVTGKSYDWYMQNGGKKHPDDSKIGKPAELGLGFGGWIGAWRQFDSTDNFTDDEVKSIILRWRDASPMIVEFWGGQCRGKPWNPDYLEYYGLEGAAVQAVLYPGQIFTVNDVIHYQVRDDVLYCKLPSGREIAYHKPRLTPETRWGNGTLQLSFEGWNTNPKYGKVGWVRMFTYSGKLCENVVQATARDILRRGVINVEKAGYPVVLRVHDEIAAEVPIGFGSVEEFEFLMADVPDWAKGWPIRAAGGWRGKRYRKD